MPLYIAKSGDLDRCYRCLTDSLTDSQMKDRATQLLIKYKSGALVTQYHVCYNLHCKLISRATKLVIDKFKRQLRASLGRREALQGPGLSGGSMSLPYF